ncbi:structural cement protein Gp24, partial [Salmonella enterica]
SDTSLYNIDGACVVGGAAPIPDGTFVGVTSAQPVDGHKVVGLPAVTGSPVKPYGVVVKSHYETPDGTARVNEAVNVMTHGRIWVRTNLAAAPAFGGKVFVIASGVVVSEAAGSTWETGFTFAGGYIKKTGTDPQDLSVDGALVEVQLIQSADSSVAA